MASTLEAIQGKVVETLKADNFLQNLTISAWPKSDVEKRIDTAVTANIGISIVVMPPIPTRLTPHVPGPCYEEMNVQVRVIENLYTLPENFPSHILGIAEAVSQCLHVKILTGEKWEVKLEHPRLNPWKEVFDKNHPSKNILELEFLAAFTICK